MKNKLRFFEKIKSILKVFMLFFAGFLFLPQYTNAQVNHQIQIVTCWDSTIVNIRRTVAMPSCNNSENIIITYGPKIPGATAIVTDSTITYYYSSIGKDTIAYTMNCSGTIVNGKLFIVVAKCPDNVQSVKCDKEITGFAWDIKEEWNSKPQTNISTYVTPLVGDLKGSGKSVQIVAAAREGSTGGSNAIYVYEGANLTLPPIKINTIEFNNAAGVLAMARVPRPAPNNDTIPIIVVRGDDRFLYAYNPYKPGYLEWKSNATAQLPTGFTTTPAAQGSVIFFADFDNCGTPEICCGNSIFNSVGGTLLTQGPAGGNKGDYTIGSGGGSGRVSMPAVGDIDGDGKLEYIAGTQIYKVNITNRAGTSGNSMPVLADIGTISIGGTDAIKDGYTALADFNGDGLLEVLVASRTSANYYGLAIWDPRTNTVLAKTARETLRNSTSAPGLGFPFIGHIDEDKELEILCTSSHNTSSLNYLNGYRWRKGSTIIDRVYRTIYQDGTSGCTAITLFDFNQSGSANLVYRDEDSLRVICAVPGPPGVEGTFQTLKAYSATSGTGWEMAIVADVNGDGAAEIVVSGDAPGGGGSSHYGTLRVYRSGNEYNWAPGRKVWNQVPYNVVNINEDLTVPKYQMNPAKFFPNKKQPFNNFLQQQTQINTDGDPYSLLANIIWDGPDPTMIYDGDSLVFEGCIKNIGEVALQKPFYVAYYKNDTILSNLIDTVSINRSIMKDSTYCYKLVLKNISAIAGSEEISSIWISINDKGTGKYPYQACCDVDGRRKFKFRNFRWWYISSPYKNSNPGAFDIPAGTLGNITGSMLGYYNEEPKQYTSPLISIANFVPGRGIAASLDTMVVDFKPPTMATFARGITPVANDGDITVSVFNTDIVPAHSAKRGINLLGNPYPSHINFNAFYNSNSTKIENTMWIRGWNRTITPATPEGLMMYDTYNAASGAGTKLINDISITSDIPPIQGFWVKAKLPGEQTVTFMNTHKTSGTQILRAPAADVNRIARIRISATATNAQDEMLIVFNPAASNGYDLYDSEKMSHGSANIPELYSRVENRELVINGMQPVINKKVEIPLGFRTGKAGENFKISATFENWDNTEVRFLDYGIQKYAILTEGDVYQFEAKGGIYPNRFTLLIDGTPNNINSIENNITFIYVNDANRIAVNTDVNNATCTVYSIIGQKLAEETIVSNPQILNCIFEAGIYLVKVGNKTEKIIIR